MKNHAQQTTPVPEPDQDQLLGWLRRLWPIRQAEKAATKFWHVITKAIFGEDEEPPSDGATPEQK